MKRLHLQPGLGDAVHALPYVIELVKKYGDVEFFTAWPEVFEQVKGVHVSKSRLPYRLGDIRFAWSRVGRKTFSQKYADDCGLPEITDFTEAQSALQFPGEFPIVDSLLECAGGANVCVLGEPRAAARHKEKKDFSCAPDPAEFWKWGTERADTYYFVPVGKNEVYPEYSEYADLRGKSFRGLSLKEFITLISYADAVASQESCFTVLASLFHVPMKIFRARSMNEAQHAEHVRRCTFNNPVFLE